MIRLLLICLLLGCAVPAQSLQRIEGVARSLDDGDRLYVELHHIDGTSHHIDYRATDGTPIGEQRLDYRCSESAPTFTQQNLRTDELHGGAWKQGRYVLQRDGQYRTLDETGLVASSGFDRFLQRHWGALLNGEVLRFPFAMPSRLDSIELRARRVEMPNLNGSNHWFRIEPAAGWLRPFVDPIVVGYDATRRLRVYRGLSNLTDVGGKSSAVEIRYSYAKTAPHSPEPLADAPRTTNDTSCPPERS